MGAMRGGQCTGAGSVPTIRKDAKVEPMTAAYPLLRCSSSPRASTMRGDRNEAKIASRIELRRRVRFRGAFQPRRFQEDA